MTVRFTSLEAYKEAVISGKVRRQRDRIFKWLLDNPQGWTRNEIAQYTGFRLSSVCGRINQLLQDNFVEEGGERKDRFTGVNSKTIVPASPRKDLPEQARLL